VPLMILTALFFNDLFHAIPETTFDATELPNLGYGFEKDGAIYLGYLARIVAIDPDGKISFTFDRKGSGPKELKSGGPIFNLGNKVFCNDVMGQKLVRFSLDLDYEKDTSLKDYKLGSIRFFNNGERLYSVSLQNDGRGVLLEQWDPDNLSKSNQKTIEIALYFERSSIIAAFVNSYKVLIWEEVQVKDHLILHTYDTLTGTLSTVGFPNPDFDERALKEPRKSHFGVLKYGVSIHATSSDNRNIYLFVKNFDEGANGVSVLAGYRYFVIRKSDMELIELREIPFISVSGHQYNPVQVMKNEAGEVVVAHSGYFLRQRNE